jgi:endoglucanase
MLTRKDVAFLAGIGLDHLRLPVDEEQLFSVDGKPESEAFDLLNQALDWCDEFSLRAVVDLHILRSHHFNEKEKPLWTQPEAQERFFQCWRDISAQIWKRSTLKVAYELMNEPVAVDPEQWNVLVERCAKTVRALEPERRLVIGSNMWQSVDTFDALRVPAGDPHIILSFHYYHPMVLTHYLASWTKVGEYKGPVAYPGRLVPEDQLQAQPPDLRKAMSPERIFFDRSTTARMFAKPLEVSQRLKLPLYCGEWGCIDRAPMEPRVRWYQDVRAVLEENRIGWATWDFKGGFGLVKSGEPVVPVIRALGLSV